MKKLFLFAIAISLCSIAFAAWPPEPLDQATCDFFGYPAWSHNGTPRSVKGCLTCPVRDEDGKYVTCEKVLEENGTINEDCCWLNTPKAPNLDPILGNCYTNGCVLGPNPWSVKCVCKLNCAMSDPTSECYANCNAIQHPNQVPGLKCNQYNPNTSNGGAGAPNGGNGNNGGNTGNAGHKTKIHKIITSQKPTGTVTPSKPVVKSEKQKTVQTSSKKTAK